MIKFFRLVQNEHIKICSKISTWVLVALMAVVSLGYTGFMKFGQMQNAQADAYYENLDYAADYENQISYLKQQDEAGNAAGIASYEFLLEHEIGYRDWRSDEVFFLFNQKELPDGDTAETERLLGYLAANDWRSYFESKLETIASDSTLSAEEKEAQGYYYRYALEHDLSPIDPDWRTTLAKQIGYRYESLYEKSQAAASDPEVQQELETIRNDILLGEYRLEHGLESYARQVSYQNPETIDFWTTLGLSNILIGVVSMIIIILASASIANEFSNGTIKFLLINPVKRRKIFLSKYVTILSVSVLLVLGFFLLNTICAGMFFGFGQSLAPYLYVADGAVHSIPGLLFVLWQYLLGSINLIVMGTLAFAISSLLRNAAVAIGVSMFAMLGGNTLVTFMGSVLKLDWARFFIFANTDLNMIMSGDSSFPYMTVGFSLAVIAVHLVIFFLTAWDGFMRRESI